ncbi:MAG: hypothetical protein ABSA02_24660 [Trebonia sp.]
MTEPAGPELREFHQIAVGVADRRERRVRAQLGRRVAERDPAAVQPDSRADLADCPAWNTSVYGKYLG